MVTNSQNYTNHGMNEHRSELNENHPQWIDAKKQDRTIPRTYPTHQMQVQWQ